MAKRTRCFLVVAIGLNALALLAILISAPNAEMSLEVDAGAIESSLLRLEALSAENSESAEQLSRLLDHEIWVLRGCTESLRQASEKRLALMYQRVDYPLMVLALLNVGLWIALMFFPGKKKRDVL